MNGWRTTKVWEINNKLVVANSIEEAIAVYQKYSENNVNIESVTAVKSSSYTKDFDALIKENNE